MPKEKTPLSRAGGKLVSAVQKVWISQGGEPNAEFSLDVLDAAHELASASNATSLAEMLGGRSVKQYLGELWVQRYPSIKPEIELFESAMRDELQKNSLMD